MFCCLLRTELRHRHSAPAYTVHLGVKHSNAISTSTTAGPSLLPRLQLRDCLERCWLPSEHAVGCRLAVTVFKATHRQAGQPRCAHGRGELCEKAYVNLLCSDTSRSSSVLYV